MKLVICICIVSATTSYVASTLSFTLTNRFLNEKNLKNVVIFDCFVNKKDQLNVLRYFIKQGLWISIFDINYFNISKQQFLTKDSNKVSGVIINADCEGSARLLLDIGEIDLYNSKHSWLVISKSRDIINSFNKVNLNIATDLYVAVNVEQKWTIFDVYNPYFKNGGKLRAENLGDYCENASFPFRRKESRYSRGRNMTEVHFKSKIVLAAHFNGSLDDYLLNDENRHINTFARFHNRLLQHCQDYYGYTVNISLSNSWGYKQSNGEFDGVLGAVIRGEIDFPAAPLALRQDRYFGIWYGRHTWLLRSSFVFRDKKAIVSMKTFFKPLAFSVWILTIVSAIFLSVILKLAFHYEKNMAEKIEASWSFAFFITMATLCQQGHYHLTSSFAARIIAISTLILSLLMYQFYSGGIMSFLLMQPTTTIQTMADIDNSGMNVGLEDILYVRDFFNHATDAATQQLYRKHTQHSKNRSIYMPATLGLKLVEKGNFAFDVDLATAYPIIDKGFSNQAICELREVPQFVRQVFFYVGKSSPVKDMFNTCLHRLAEFGVMYRQLRHWHHRKPVCIDTQGYRTFNLSLNEVYPPFCVLFIGILGSFVILIAELMHKYVMQQLKQQIKPIKPFVK